MITPKLSSEKAEPAHSGDHSPTLPGGQHTRNLRLRGPMGFLIFIVPMPDAMADTLETASAVASAEAASFFFNLTSTPTLRDGTVFQLPNITIQVGQECSGIRSSWVLFITSLLAANLFLKSGWRRAVLVCFVIPLGIARNGLRVAVIGNLCVHIGPQMIHCSIP